jgi:hypothetical protein
MCHDFVESLISAARARIACIRSIIAVASTFCCLARRNHPVHFTWKSVLVEFGRGIVISAISLSYAEVIMRNDRSPKGNDGEMRLTNFRLCQKGTQVTIPRAIVYCSCRSQF